MAGRHGGPHSAAINQKRPNSPGSQTTFSLPAREKRFFFLVVKEHGAVSVEDT